MNALRIKLECTAATNDGYKPNENENKTLTEATDCAALVGRTPKRKAACITAVKIYASNLIVTKLVRTLTRRTTPTTIQKMATDIVDATDLFEPR